MHASGNRGKLEGLSVRDWLTARIKQKGKVGNLSGVTCCAGMASQTGGIRLILHEAFKRAVGQKTRHFTNTKRCTAGISDPLRTQQHVICPDGARKFALPNKVAFRRAGKQPLAAHDFRGQGLIPR